MSFADRDGVIWMDGELVPWREATIHVLTHSLHYGVGIFEGVRAYKTDRGTGHIPAAGPHRATVPLRADHEYEDPLRPGHHK